MSDLPLADEIYEAAFEPGKWESVLTGLSRLTESDSGSVVLFDDVQPVAGHATGLSREALARAMEGDPIGSRGRIQHFYSNPIAGFVDAATYFPEQVSRDVMHHKLVELGLSHQLGTIIPMPGGELAIFVMHRQTSDGPYPAAVIEMLNRFHPHLSRAALIASRLGLERARSTVATLEALGIPAAVLSRAGKVRAANALLDDVADTLMPVAFGGMAIAHAPANRLFQDAIMRAGDTHDDAVRSIPVPSRDGREALILHVVPLYYSAQEMFSGADIMVAATRVSPGRMVPSPTVLMGLFDLTPAEVRLASSLAKGHSLTHASEQGGIKLSTARSYLESIFRKTGTHQQSELVALLKSAQPLK